MSPDEPCGIVYVEAMATGLSVVAHDCPNTRWIVEDAGQLVDTTKLPAVVHAVSTSLTDGFSRSRLSADVDWRTVTRRFAHSLSDGSVTRSTPRGRVE